MVGRPNNERPNAHTLHAFDFARDVERCVSMHSLVAIKGVPGNLQEAETQRSRSSSRRDTRAGRCSTCEEHKKSLIRTLGRFVIELAPTKRLEPRVRGLDQQ